MCAFLAGEMFGSLLLNSFFGQGVHHGVIESQSLGQLAHACPQITPPSLWSLIVEAAKDQEKV